MLKQKASLFLKVLVYQRASNSTNTNLEINHLRM